MNLIYIFFNSKIAQYSPSDSTKQYEKSVSRKSNNKFNPSGIIKILKERENKSEDEEIDEQKKKEIINEYLDFKAMMLKIDNEEEDDSDYENQESRRSNLDRHATRTRAAQVSYQNVILFVSHLLNIL